MRGHANPVHEFGLRGIALGPLNMQRMIPTLSIEDPRLSTQDPQPQWSNYRDLKDDYEKQQKAETLAPTAIINYLGDTPSAP
jgi:hypothetical protein